MIVGEAKSLRQEHRRTQGKAKSKKSSKAPTGAPRPITPFPTEAPLAITPFPVATETLSPDGASNPTESPIGSAATLPTSSPVDSSAAPLPSTPSPTASPPTPAITDSPTAPTQVITDSPTASPTRSFFVEVCETAVPEGSSEVLPTPVLFEYRLTMDKAESVNDAIVQMEEIVHSELSQALLTCEFNEVLCRAHTECLATLVDENEACCPNTQGFIQTCCDLDRTVSAFGGNESSHTLMLTQIRYTQSFFMSQLSSAPWDVLKDPCEADGCVVVVRGGVTPDIFYTESNRRRLVEDPNVAQAFSSTLRPAIDESNITDVIEAVFLGLVDPSSDAGGDTVGDEEEGGNGDEGVAGAQVESRGSSSGLDSNQLAITSSVVAVAVVALVVLAVVALRRKGREKPIDHVELDETFSHDGDNFAATPEPVQRSFDFDGDDFMAEPQFDVSRAKMAEEDGLVHVVSEWEAEGEQEVNLEHFKRERSRGGYSASRQRSRDYSVEPTFVATKTVLKERPYAQSDTVDL